jgi:site-specific DNA-methyltransferase (adenine-specific)
MEKLEKITLYNADCMDVMRTFKDNQFDLAIVDPPYGINAGKMTMGSGKHKFSKDKDWDNGIPNGDYFDELFRVSKNQVIWGGNYFTEYLNPSPHWLIWDKKNPNLSFAEGEMAWVRSGKNLRIFAKYSAVVEDGGKIHPTQKPVQLYKWILQNYAKEGDTILDTHFGSLSIGIACHDLGFELTAIELDAEYYEKAKLRLKHHQQQQVLFMP